MGARLLTTGLLGGVLTAQADPGSEVDGLYFLSAPPGSSRLLELRGQKFVVSIDHRYRIEGTAHWSRTEGASAQGVLRLAYFDGAGRRDLTTGLVSCALVDGELWAGVLHAEVATDPVVWRGAFECPRLFMPAASAPPPGRVEWRVSEGTWTFRPLDAAEPIEQNGLTAELAERFELRFEKAPFGDAFGFPFAGRSFERRGDIILTPWSVRLGRGGLRPVRMTAERIRGVWRHGNDEVEMTPDAKLLRWSLLAPPQDAKPRQILYSPDVRGVSVWVVPFVGHPPMSHGDYPVHEYWLAVAEDKLVRYSFRGGCHGQTPPRGPVVFTRSRK